MEEETLTEQVKSLKRIAEHLNDDIRNINKYKNRKIKKLQERLQTQREINKSMVDVIYELKKFVFDCMHEKNNYTVEEIEKLLEL